MGWIVLYSIIIILGQPFVRESDDIMIKLVLTELFLLLLSAYILQTEGKLCTHRRHF
jgi:hypothetical protein